ncbi:hypothetical protein QCE62_00125 [Caballeronia sp. LZ033]|uniref:hypothetical protein n=1 Tax=Caballeronia sp. LZ033 TaxID=3038566 RepID=UPI002858D353|nr:hypothetical protein [Caballeronia sp. LZ033]MDR5811993.1 hypothetical protein [Caballeronia sp. LZ033]
MKSQYNKPKDRYLAAVFVVVGFVCIPFSILWFLLLAIKDAALEAKRDLRREFEGGPRATAKYAYGVAIEGLAYRRARRARQRNA